MSSKRCFRCLCVKPIEAFYKHPNMADGRLNKCKPCTKSDVAAHRQANLEQVRQYDKTRSPMPHRIALKKRANAEWRFKHPERRQAQLTLGYAVKSGQIAPWPVCAIPDCNCKPEAHHPDYDQPLDVVWLCRAHHAQAHALSTKAA